MVTEQHTITKRLFLNRLKAHCMQLKKRIHAAYASKGLLEFGHKHFKMTGGLRVVCQMGGAWRRQG
jgi:hypothetical protein